MPDPMSRLHPIMFCPSKEALAIVCKTGRSGWPGQVLAKRIRSGSGNPLCKNRLARFCQSDTERPATTFPRSDPVMIFHRRLGSCCAKSARVRFGSGSLGQVLAHWVRFWLTGSGSGSLGQVLAHWVRFWLTGSGSGSLGQVLAHWVRFWLNGSGSGSLGQVLAHWVRFWLIGSGSGQKIRTRAKLVRKKHRVRFSLASASEPS